MRNCVKVLKIKTSYLTIIKFTFFNKLISVFKNSIEKSVTFKLFALICCYSSFQNIRISLYNKIINQVAKRGDDEELAKKPMVS